MDTKEINENEGGFPNGSGQLDHLILLARHVHAFRQKRGYIFGSNDLFGEPAWDILLDLFIAACEGKTVSISSACIGAGVPTTTALRWINTLEARGMVVRDNDPDDARRVFLRLKGETKRRMERYLTSVYPALTGNKSAVA
ncbi:MAG: hypothetical protein RLZZ136_1619 [Pseudomonadota bacterium]